MAALLSKPEVRNREYREKLVFVRRQLRAELIQDTDRRWPPFAQLAQLTALGDSLACRSRPPNWLADEV
jgi:hypothetical protein